MKQKKVTPPEKRCVTVNGVSLMTETNRKKSEKDFVKENKHSFGGDETKTKDAFRLFGEAVKAQDAEYAALETSGATSPGQ